MKPKSKTREANPFYAINTMEEIKKERDPQRREELLIEVVHFLASRLLGIESNRMGK